MIEDANVQLIATSFEIPQEREPDEAAMFRVLAILGRFSSEMAQMKATDL
jgi:hypothetical protein